MTTSIISVDAATSKLQVGGVDSFSFTSGGIISGAGKRLAQIQTFQTGAVATGNTVLPFDNTIPQITEGDQYMSLSITPTNVNSTLEIDVEFLGGGSVSLSAGMAVALFQDSNVNALAACPLASITNNTIGLFALKHTLTAGSLSTTTFKVRAGCGGAGTTTFNGQSAAQFMGGIAASRITIKEYLP